MQQGLHGLGDKCGWNAVARVAWVMLRPSLDSMVRSVRSVHDGWGGFHPYHLRSLVEGLGSVRCIGRAAQSHGAECMVPVLTTKCLSPLRRSVAPVASAVGRGCQLSSRAMRI